MLIAFEGVNCCGKTTQIEELGNFLTNDLGEEKIFVTRQPGGSEVGSEIRKILLKNRDESQEQINPYTEASLFLADRIQHCREVIEPKLREGHIILCDRYQLSQDAFQFSGRQMDRGLFSPLIDKFVRKPDLTIYLRISLEESFKRVIKRGEEIDRMESESEEYHQRVFEFYEWYSSVNKDSLDFCVIDGEQHISKTHSDICRNVIKFWREKFKNNYTDNPF